MSKENQFKYWPFLIAVILFSSCRKDEQKPILPSELNGESDHLVGEWEWDSTAVWYQLFGAWPSGYMVYSDSVHDKHSVKIYREGRIDLMKNNQIEKTNYFRLDTFTTFSQVDPTKYWFRLLINNDSLNRIGGMIGDNNTPTIFDFNLLRLNNSYPIPSVDTVYDTHFTYFSRM